MLSIIFTALIVGSVQPVLADEITDLFKPVRIRNSEYQFHLVLSRSSFAFDNTFLAFLNVVFFRASLYSSQTKSLCS